MIRRRFGSGCLPRSIMGLPQLRRRRPGRKYAAQPFSAPCRRGALGLRKRHLAMIPIPFCLKDERSWIIRCGRVAAGPSLALALVLLALSPPAFASEPEIVRVRVPATQTSKWFPGGTELRVMPAEQFESLVNSATEGSIRERAARPPLLIRARHPTTGPVGVLTGQTELVIAGAFGRTGRLPARPLGARDRFRGRAAAENFRDGELPRNPFTDPAVAPPVTSGLSADPLMARVLGARDSGKSSLWIDRQSRRTREAGLAAPKLKRTQGEASTWHFPAMKRPSWLWSFHGLGSLLPGGAPPRPASGASRGSQSLGSRSRVRSDRARALRSRWRRVATRIRYLGLGRNRGRPSWYDGSCRGAGQLVNGVVGGARSAESETA